ncbi:fibronectin type III domain-containing protein [Nonomuraea sp. NPDC049152]|uniref:fibronectin type III domain-containing protein n=1 Tax=Nonomuraea sp. NPDC049152 TaxID=3154350 RepID=UPI0033F665C4
MPKVIIPGQVVRHGLRLVAHEPNGVRLGPLSAPLKFEMALPLNDISSLKVTYSRHAQGADLLTSPVEVAVEHYDPDTGSWVEAANARFLRLKRAGQHTDQTASLTFTCPGYGWQMRKVVLYAGGTMVEGKRQFSAVTPGAILRTFTTEGQARGAIPGLGVSFSTTHDSAGQAWNKQLTLGLEPGIDLLTLLINLSEQGVCDWQLVGRTLHVYNEGGFLATNRASGAAPVDLRLGRDIVEAPDDATLEDLSSAILIRGEGGLAVEVTNPSAATPWGRWETHQSQGGVSDSGTATLLGQIALQRAAGERVQITRGIDLDAARWLPLVHYKPGDYVLAPGDQATMQSLRVWQITLGCEADGHVSGNLILNDRFLERDIKLARKAAGILTGGVGSGGSGGTPAPEPGGRTPAAPQGLVVNPIAYIDGQGYPQGQITATWSPVTADVNGVAIDVNSYELYGRENTPGGIWQQIAVVDGGDTTATYSPLRVNIEYAFKVRATAAGVQGGFSSQVIVVIPDDVTPPPVPSTPVVTTRLGMIHVAWDGLGTGAVAMPSDFDRVRVWLADPLVPGSAHAVDYLEVAGSIVIGGQPYNVDREVWLTARDRSGNESGQSAHVTVATAPLVNTDVIGQIISGANLQNGTVNAADKVIANTITGGLVQALAIDTGHLKANAITADKLAAGSITAGKLEAVLTLSTRIVAGSPTGARVELGQSGIRGFNASGVETISLLNTGAFTLRSAASGARIQLDASGLKAFNSSNQVTVDISSSTGNATFVGQMATGFSGARMIFNPPGTVIPEIRFTPALGTSNGTIKIHSNSLNPDHVGMTFETSNAGGYQSRIELHPNVISLAMDVPGTQARNFIIFNDNYVEMGTMDGGVGKGRIQTWTDGDVFIEAPDNMYLNAGTSLHINGPTVTINGNVKTFIIDHPDAHDRYLIHATTESPHNGVEYWGDVTLDEQGHAVVELPTYFEALTSADGRAVLLTECGEHSQAASATYPHDGQFAVHGQPRGRIFWLVKAIRKDVPPLLVEPRRDEVLVHGDGPYRHYSLPA